ncbi:CDCP2 protein, partial [Atractosteus spatula]|nr:CDCP2 protein [Atractosteus spatula]
MSFRIAVLIPFLSAINQAVPKKGVKCGGILSAPTGNISSPNFPGLYPCDTECVWLIVVAEGSSVLLTFHHFELEYHDDCAYDYVQIYNGASQDQGNLLGTFCGENSPPPFTSSWHVMSIVFRSDRHVAHSGFSVGYRKDVCGGVLTGLSGTISSPDYPDSYPNNAECSWTVRVSNRTVVSLVFLDFQLENNEQCGFDYVAVFDGPTARHRPLGNYCGSETPPSAVSSSSQLLVSTEWSRRTDVKWCWCCVLHTRGNTNAGEQELWECQQIFTAIKGNFSSPQYPDIYPNNINCHWTVSLAAGYRVKLYASDMELEDRNSLTDACDYDSLAVHDGSSQRDPLLGRWCGSEMPPPLLSKSNKLLVVLNTDRNAAYRGFSISYIGELCLTAAPVFLCVQVVPVNVSCSRTDFQIQISQQALPQLDRYSVYLGNPSCAAQMTATTFKIIARFVTCGTESQSELTLRLLHLPDTSYYPSTTQLSQRSEAVLVLSHVLQRRRNATVMVNTLYVDFSDGQQENIQEYEVQCEPRHKEASINIISGDDRYRLNQLTERTDTNTEDADSSDADFRGQDTSDIVFISICVLAGILMLIAIIGLVLL